MEQSDEGEGREFFISIYENSSQRIVLHGLHKSLPFLYCVVYIYIYHNHIDINPVVCLCGVVFAPQDQVVMSGWMMKRGEIVRGWRRRFFHLYKDGESDNEMNCQTTSVLWGAEEKSRCCEIHMWIYIYMVFRPLKLYS